ncbi:MAG: T9SS type A sorting domain-containing protein [Flavipsychrobacter sp.]|nr:T9SS type A sorting domain-containing protein [Flavipsychrobacter sp.]
MKKILSVIALIALSCGAVKAQIHPYSDTVYISYSSPATYPDPITPLGGSSTLHWSVGATTFPVDWLPLTTLCDNRFCYLTHTLIRSNNPAPVSAPYLANVAGIFSLSLDLTTAATYGQYYLTVDFYDPANAANTFSETYIVAYNGSDNNPPKKEAGVSALVANDISVYPNPASNDLAVTVPDITDVTSISICDIYGRQIQQQTVNNSVSHLDVSSLSSGTYFIQIHMSNNNSITKKFIRL